MGQSPLKVCILGSEAVGKTSFLGGLMVLGDPNRASGFTVMGENEVTKRFLYDRQTELVEHRQFPASTSATESLSISVTYGLLRILISVVEFPGEGFRVAANFGQWSSVEEFHKQLLGADVLLLMFDPNIEGQDLKDLDPADAHHIQDRQRALLDSLNEACRRASNPPDLGIIVTKADRYPEISKPDYAASLLKERLPYLMKRIEAELSAKPKYFAISSVGSVEEEMLPDGRCSFRPAANLKPRGYEELFQWIIDRKLARDSAPRRRLIRWAIALLATITVVFAAVVWIVSNYYSGQLADQNVPIEDLAEIPRSGPFAPSARRFADRAAQELDQVEKRLKNQPSRDDLRQSIIPMLRKVEKLAKGTPQEKRRDTLETSAKHQLEDSWSRDLANRGLPTDLNFDEYERDVREFIAEFPESSHAPRLNEQLENTRRQIDQQLRAAINTIHAGDLKGQESAFLRRKADAIDKYLSNPHCRLEEKKKAGVQRATHLAKLLADSHSFRVKCQSLGPLADERRTRVEIRSRKTDLADWNVIAAWQNDDPATTKHWDDERVLDWSPGEALQVQIMIYRSRLSPFKAITDPGYVWLPNQNPATTPLALKTLSSSQKLAAGDVSGSWVITDWKTTVIAAELRMEVKTNTSESETIRPMDWRLLERYVDPGADW